MENATKFFELPDYFIILIAKMYLKKKCIITNVHCCPRWRGMQCSASSLWTGPSWLLAAPPAQLISLTLAMLECSTRSVPTASPVCVCPSTLSCLPLQPHVTGQERSRSGTDYSKNCSFQRCIAWVEQNEK